jgi:bifunctional UDP-N-acetylglucosamine pyrophosphorylase / glucosamine-1-phosphate N-acetyltransferase
MVEPPRKPTAWLDQSPSDGGGLAAIVLAAGQGTRMRSQRAKVLHEILGRAMIAYPVEAARNVGASPVVAVLGHQSTDVQAVLVARFGEGGIVVAEQTQQRGTGHATSIGLGALDDFAGDLVLILYGDVPLLRRETLIELVASSRQYGCLSIVATTPPDPTGYGRILRDGRGHVIGIVEERDASAEERALTEVNAGIYCGPLGFFRDATAGLAARNAQGEYYLTDVVARAADGIGVATVDADWRDVAGINDRAQLADAEAVMRARVNRAVMAHATLREPATTSIDLDVAVDEDVEIGRNVALRGRTRVARGARIGDGSILVDTEVGADADVRPYTLATKAVIGPGAIVGPFAHLRPGTELGPDAHIGNFVETKNTIVGTASKANHLSYLGDTIIGANVNVGAGTISCNYNGYEKRQTIIEDGAFIGSDTQLVAPVRIGAGAVVGAGTTVTKDVPAGALALTRGEQTETLGYAEKLAKKYADKGKSG